MKNSLIVLSIILAGIGILCTFSSSSLKTEERTVLSPEVTNTAPRETNSPHQTLSSNKIGRVKNKGEESLRYKSEFEIVESTIRTNSNGYIIEDYRLANGRTGRSIKPPNPIFKHPSDQVIALAISTEPGRPMPPLPDLNNIDKDFIESLSTPIVIEETDSRDVKELKRRVIKVKADLAEQVKNGGSVLEALTAHQDEMNRLSESRLMAIREMQHIREEEGLEAAQRFARLVNKKFDAEGIPAIPVVGMK